MNQQPPDNFFREKLENFQRPAPVAAWDRIENQLKKNDTKGVGLWWKVAASFLLLATAAYLIWPAKISDQPVTSIPVQNEIPTAKSTDKTNHVSPAPMTTLKPVERIAAVEKIQNVRKKPIQKTPVKNDRSAQALESPVEQESSAEVVADIADTMVADETLTSAPAHQPKKIRLQFSTEETNKYLDENAVAKATSEEKKSSTLKKLLKKANDLKSNQDPFGDLREKKNEILALNFKNEKRGQNK